ncbi:uncharacterized protein LOC110115076 isoform X3 [Dendrobium catenatum]|uniref:uncharacterized protein LOC110115076 isoform X3 n=1 Tax=Dendrobium catenatum TaxID=906689 RepID=UPI0009F1B5C2|nr:uncharacterized protein LOC110115076 isoform X3 [Dendrobium catenatum]
MDSDMVIEVPDTPERAALTRSVSESSSRNCGIKDKPSSSNQYLEPKPMIRTYSRQMKNCGPHDFNGKCIAPVDNDFLFSQARIARVISDIPANRKIIHSSNCSPKRGQIGGLNENGTNPKAIELSQESPVRCRSSRNKEEKHLSWQTGRNQITGYGKLSVKSSSSMEGLRKDRNNADSSLKEYVSFCTSNDAENVKSHATAVSSGKEKMIAQQDNSRTRNEQLESKHPEIGLTQRDVQQKKLSNGNNNSQAEPYYEELRNLANQGASSSPIVTNFDIEIGDGPAKVSQSITRQQNYRRQELVLHPKNTGHRRLVRNGCISPFNIARNKNDAKAKGIEEGRVISSKIPINNSSKSVHHFSFEGRTTDKGKGKEVMNDEYLASSQHAVVVPPYRRSLMPQKEVISDMDYDSGRIQIDGYSATHKQEGSSSLLPSSHAACISETENMSSHLSSSRGEIAKGCTKYAPSVTYISEEATSQSGQNITQVQGCFKLNSEAPQLTGKRKINFTHSSAGECSNSAVDSPRISYDRTSLKHSFPRSTRSRKSVEVDNSLAPIVEIDELDGNTQVENHELSDESIARSIQLESDEVLARQLQEQFYLESPPVGATEEEDDLHAFQRRRNQSHQREALRPTLLGRPIFRHPSTRMTARARTENRTGRIRRNISRPTMSLEERLDFLEALEAAFEHGNDMETPDHFLGFQRDFNEDDYEMLLALDENNHNVGASERQINSLPQSVIQQNTDSEEACAVCLETPVVGDAIRHLPCLHKFHKDCIDTWLRRKRSCPICKSGIT